MDRPGTIVYNSDFLEFKNSVAEETGFTCYEVNPGDQQTWFGTSSKFDDFKAALAEVNTNTGTVAFVMDTGKKYMYSAFTENWYEV